MGLAAAHRAVRLRPEEACRDDLLQRRRGLRHLDQGARAPHTGEGVPAGEHRRRRRHEFLVAWTDGTLRSVQRGLRRSRPAAGRGPARVRPRRELRSIPGDLEFRVPAIRPQAGRHADPAGEAEHRHRRGPRASRAGAPGRPGRRVQDRPVPAAHQEDRVALRKGVRVGRRDDHVDADRRRAHARGDVLHRRRDRSVERVARLRAAPSGPPRGAARPQARDQDRLPAGPRRGGREDDAAASPRAHLRARPHRAAAG